MAEAVALRNGVQKAIHLGYINLVVEGDNATVIQALRREIVKPWTIANIIQDTGKCLILCGIVNVRHTFREGNRAADWLQIPFTFTTWRLSGQLPHHLN